MADSFSWRGGAGTSWTTAANWFDNTTGSAATRAPVFGDTAVLSGNVGTVIVPAQATEIDVAPGGTLVFQGDPTASGNNLVGASTFRVGAGGTAAMDGAVLEVGSTAISIGATLDLTNAPAGTGLARLPGSAGLGNLSIARGGELVLDGHHAVVGQLVNENQGTGNGFDPRAGISGTGTLFQNPYSDQADVRVLVNGQPTGGLDFGTVKQGSTASITFTLENFAGNAGGIPAQGAIQTSANGAHITDPALSGSGVTAQNFTIGGRGGSATYTITLDTSQPHTLDGQVLHIAYQFNHGLFDGGDTLAITGKVVADVIDWNALAAQVQAAHAATGAWYVPGESDIPAGPVDWNALAATVNAHFAQTGTWWLA